MISLSCIPGFKLCTPDACFDSKRMISYPQINKKKNRYKVESWRHFIFTREYQNKILRQKKSKFFPDCNIWIVNNWVMDVLTVKYFKTIIKYFLRWKYLCSELFITNKIPKCNFYGNIVKKARRVRCDSWELNDPFDKHIFREHKFNTVARSFYIILKCLLLLCYRHWHVEI